MLQRSQLFNFANFLERLATIGVSPQHWRQHINTHYPDKIMEEARIAIVELTLKESLEESLQEQRRIHLESSNTEIRQIQALAANLVNFGHNQRVLIKEEWWLDWYIWSDNQFLDVNWARIQVFSDLSAEVFDIDGRTYILKMRQMPLMNYLKMNIHV